MKETNLQTQLEMYLSLRESLGGVPAMHRSALASFVGYLGLSIALNNGVCQPEKPATAPVRSVLPFRTLPPPRPAFQR